MKSVLCEIDQRLGLLSRVGRAFVVCRRARVVALLRLWPEGEVNIKVEMRTGKRLRRVRVARSVGFGVEWFRAILLLRHKESGR